MRGYFILIMLLVLVACNNEPTDSKVNDTEEDNDSSVQVIAEVNQKIESNLVEIELTNVEFVPEDGVGNYPFYKINFTVINNSDDAVWLGTDQQSIDDTMAEDLFTASDDIAPGKKMNDSFQIIAYDEELPEIKHSIEFNIDVVTDMERQETHEIKIEID